MRKPLDRLKFLPWRSLFSAAALAVLVLALPVDLLLQSALHYREQVPTLAKFLPILQSPLFALIIGLGIPVGLGALAVYGFERIDRVSINTSSLWALVLCLVLVRLVERGIVFSAIGASMVELVLIAVGVFWKGRPYWHSYRQW